MKIKTLLTLITLTIYNAQLKSQCTFGNFPPSYSVAASFGDNYLLGDKYNLPLSSTLTGLAYKGNGTAATMRMAIYTDISGTVGTLVAYTNTTTVGTGNTIIPVLTSTIIPAGDYWILATYTGGSSSGHVNYIGADASKTTAYISLTPSSIPPTSATWTYYANQDFDYWAVTSNTMTVDVVASPSLICIGGTSNLSTTIMASSYSWSNGASTSSITVTPTITSTYTLSVVTASSCLITNTVSVVVSPCTAVNELFDANNISIYPNPTINNLNINLSTDVVLNNTSVEFYDAMGKLVLKELLTEKTTSLNLSHLTNGIYTYKVLSNAIVLKVGKITKQN